MPFKIKKCKTVLKRYFGDEEGVTAIEYALMLAIISVALIAAMSLLASTQSTMWDKVSTTLNEANP